MNKSPYATVADAGLGDRVNELNLGAGLAAHLGLLVNKLAWAAEVDAGTCYWICVLSAWTSATAFLVLLLVVASVATAFNTSAFVQEVLPSALTARPPSS